MAPISLPPFAPVPPAAVREIIQVEEWKACLDAWIVLAETRLNLTEKEFNLSAPKDESAISFLSTYFQEASSPSASLFHKGVEAKRLRRLCFLLVRRFLLEARPPPIKLLDWNFLGNFSEEYVSSRALETLLREVWKREGETVTLSIENEKQVVIKQLSVSGTAQSPELLSTLRKLTLLSSTLPQAGHVLMTGSDYLDTLSESYQSRKDPNLRKALVANVYVGLVSLTKSEPPLISLLLDHLFSLKATAMNPKSSANEPTLLSDLICSSNFLSRIQGFFAAAPQKRSETLLSSLHEYQKETSSLHTRYRRPRKIDKGKGRAADIVDANEIDTQKMSLITQVQDLFPDLGSGYVSRLLDYFSGNAETVISHLLDGSLPPDLQTLDQSEPLSTEAPIIRHEEPIEPSLPQSTQTQSTFTRKNRFDNDAFDRLAISDSNLHFGRANPDLTADDVLADRTHHSTNKAAILSALEAFDSDEDERDDTYDVADVGGTVDSGPARADDDEVAADLRHRNETIAQEANELTLFRLYKSSPETFNRTAATRRSKQRVALRRDTGMTDEAIEGWALMLVRDPKRLAKLEGKNSLSAGSVGQRELAPTAYRKPNVTDSEGNATGTEESEAERTDGGRGDRGGGGRGGRRGGNRGGRGGRGRGDVAGPSGDRDTAAARQKKDANKSSRANHNRRDQRAKKMARGGI